MIPIERTTWNLLPSEAKHKAREEYAAQFGKSWVQTVLWLQRKGGNTYVRIRLKADR